MKTLLLLRHGKSSWEDPTLRDIDRPLTEGGRKAAQRMGRLIAERDLVPDHVVCSTAIRARETWDALSTAFEPAVAAVFEDRLYDAEPETLLQVIRIVPEERERALLIGHNPGIERLAGRLAGTAAGETLRRMAVKFPTAALAVLRFERRRWVDINLASGRLEDFVIPREVEEA